MPGTRHDDELLSINDAADLSGHTKPADGKSVRRKRKRPFEAEWALLRELGLAK